jgi:hypothetical protein
MGSADIAYNADREFSLVARMVEKAREGLSDGGLEWNVVLQSYTERFPCLTGP